MGNALRLVLGSGNFTEWIGLGLGIWRFERCCFLELNLSTVGMRFQGYNGSEILIQFVRPNRPSFGHRKHYCVHVQACLTVGLHAYACEATLASSICIESIPCRLSITSGSILSALSLHLTPKLPSLSAPISA